MFLLANGRRTAACEVFPGHPKFLSLQLITVYKQVPTRHVVEQSWKHAELVGRHYKDDYPTQLCKTRATILLL